MARQGTGWVMGVAGLAGSFGLAGLGGCIPSEKTDFDAAGPSKRLQAIVEASGTDADPRSLPRLVEQLDSQDPAARMLAIRALENRTGTTLGFNHTDPEWKRQESIERWIKYLESGGSDLDLLVEAGGQP